MEESNGLEREHPVPPHRLFKRLAQVPGYTWNQSVEPFHSSYDNWHIFGLRRLGKAPPLNGTSSPEPARTNSTKSSPRTEPRASYSQPTSSVSDNGSEIPSAGAELKKAYLPVIARISTHTLRLEREFQLCKSLIQTSDPECKHIVRPLELVRLPSQQGDQGPLVVSIFESPGLNYLKELVNFGPAWYGGPTTMSPRLGPSPESIGVVPGDQISLPLFLDFAIGASECLELLHHGQRIVHGELRGDAFHFSQHTGLVKLINFGSGLRSFEHGLTSVGWSSLSKEVGVKNKLQFIAPEQTGRMPTEPDSRTDIYSLGVLFWIMLTREPAFDGETPMDIIQCVLSRRIAPASSKRLDIPDILSAIIQKMTQKQIDDRYHSVSGLKYDLLELRRILGDGDGEALRNLKIGTRDVSSFFILPSNMFGRQKEHDIIVKVIKKVLKRHKSTMSPVKNGMYSLSSNSSISDGRHDSFGPTDESSEGANSHNGDGSRQNSSSGPSLLAMGPQQNSQDSIDSVVTINKPPLESKASIETKNSLDSKASTSSFDGETQKPGGSQQDGAGSLAHRSNSQKFRRKGRCEVITIAGAAGLGKSCLVQSVQIEARRHGYFASAKFDQAKKSPFEPVLKVMSSLFRQIFSESDVSTDFHNMIRAYVRPVWSVLHTMLDLPDFLLRGSSNLPKSNSGHISQHPKNRSLRAEFPHKDNSSISSQSSLHASSTSHSAASDYLRGGSAPKSTRFTITFLDVLRLLAVHKFICLCVDDLQFADEESLDLISSIVSSKIRIVLIVTYRPEEFLSRRVRSLLGTENANVTKITLSPLTEDDIADYVCTTLSRPREYVIPLAAVIQEKSNGNPFYMREMLNTCHRKNCLWYSWKTSSWEYDLDRIFQQFETENYGQRLNGDFIVKRLQEMPEAARSIVAWASLLGNTFSFSLVQKLMGGEFDYDEGEHTVIPTSAQMVDVTLTPDKNTIAGLQAALQAFILVPGEEDDQFRFSHDRYIQAAASLRECLNVEKMQFIIATTMMKYHNLDDRSIYARSGHICEAINLIKKRVTYRSSFRDLLAQSAQKASESGARPTALFYYLNCLKLLQSDPWDESMPDAYYDESLQLYVRSAECYWYQGQSADALKLLQETLDRAKTPVDKAPSWILQSRILSQRGDAYKAFKVLKAALVELGMEIGEATWESCDKEFDKLLRQLQITDREKLLRYPPRENRNLAAVGTILIDIVSNAFWSDPLLFYQMTLMEISTHLTQGSFAQIGLSYIHFSIIAISRHRMIPFALEMGNLSKDLISRFEHSYAVGRGHTVHSLFIAHLEGHIKNQLPVLEAAMDYTLLAGDRGLTLLSLGSIAICKLYSSEDLVDVEAFCTYAPEEISNWADDLRGGTILIAVRQVARAFQGKTYWKTAGEVLSDQHHSSMQYIEYLLARASTADRPLDIYNSLAMAPLYLLGHFKKAIEVGNFCLATNIQLSTLRHQRLLLFYISLSMLAVLRQDTARVDQAAIVDQVIGYKKQIEEWQVANDVNYAMWSLLLAAELCDLSGDYTGAMHSYETALDHCQLHGFVLEEALSYQLQGEYYLRQGAKRVAQTTIQECIAAYTRISALGIVKHIAGKHETLLNNAKNVRMVDAESQTTEVLRDTQNTSYRLEENERQATHKLGSETSQDRTRNWLAPNVAIKEEPEAKTGFPAVGLDMIDLTSILESSQVISSELQIDRLLAKMTEIILDSTGGQTDYAAVIVEENEDWIVAASGDGDSGVTPYNPGLALSDVDQVSKQVAHYALRFKETVFSHNLLEDERFSNVTGTYLTRNPSGKSVIALPILHGSDSLLGVVYLEGQPNSFTDRNLAVLDLLVAQMSISIANAQLFKRIQKVSASNMSMIESQKKALAQAREAEKKAKLAEAEAMRSVRLKEEAAKAKSMFLANVSHELRTPLNGVIGMSELLKGTTLDQEQGGYADSIRVCADTLLTVINDILDFSKLEAGKMKMFSVPMNLNETIAEVVRALRFTNTERGLETIEELELDRGLLVMGDPVRLHQIFMNLLSNSYKFTPKGSVTVRAVTDFEDKSSIQVTCSVADTGIGITQEQLTKLFKPFSQADSSTARSYGGSGLGLSICKAMIENVLNGKIWLQSTPGIGTTVFFTLTFPKAPKDTTATVSEISASDPDPMAIYSPPPETASVAPSINSYFELSSIPREQLRICIAEDNPINQKIAISFVTKLGFKSDAYSDGLQAVEALRKKSAESQPYHLVLMDVQMPVLDGYEATRLIRKDEDPVVRGVLVIAMTASAIRGDREKCLDAGMNDYLAKPVRAQVLKSKLEEYLEQPPKPIANIQHAANELARSVIDDKGSIPVPHRPTPSPNAFSGGITPTISTVFAGAPNGRNPHRDLEEDLSSDGTVDGISSGKSTKAKRSIHKKQRSEI
ncbi:MAG: hypothetical protein M1827_005325 [Pycnora praestabilis]|nr:MAG: hypothetical protein M1827_005325 [Pycnora praestabilis]